MAGSDIEITIEDRTMPAISGEKHDTKWKKGQSGNPNGRPVGSVSIVEGIKHKLLEIQPENKKTYLELFLNKLFLKAIKDGNEQLMRDMIDRVDGKPTQKLDMTVEDVSGKLDELERTNYETVGLKAGGQMVAVEQSLQDKE